jgi:hypothetical protein
MFSIKYRPGRTLAETLHDLFHPVFIHTAQAGSALRRRPRRTSMRSTCQRIGPRYSACPASGIREEVEHPVVKSEVSLSALRHRFFGWLRLQSAASPNTILSLSGFVRYETLVENPPAHRLLFAQKRFTWAHGGLVFSEPRVHVRFNLGELGGVRAGDNRCSPPGSRPCSPAYALVSNCRVRIENDRQSLRRDPHTGGTGMVKPQWMNIRAEIKFPTATPHSGGVAGGEARLNASFAQSGDLCG